MAVATQQPESTAPRATASPPRATARITHLEHQEGTLDESSEIKEHVKK